LTRGDWLALLLLPLAWLLRRYLHEQDRLDAEDR
jgi:hypothetical protein